MTVASKLTGCPTCGATISVDARFCGSCGTAISATEPTQAGAAGAADSGDDHIGREIAGRYRVLAKLGEGGMGAVFRAEQISLKRKVALKLLKPELSADAGLVRRFNAEAELAAKLNHPNTVTLYDFGQDSDGSLFIAMEFIEGQSLRDVMVTEGPLEVPRIIYIGDQVCASLADAHGHGIVHRDLKPDNVMLSVRGKRSDVVRVLDFGIAKLRDTQGDMTQMPMTQAGDLLGTPQYMAPEQIRGEKVDARTDIYAMGAMIYELVTGRLPFEAPTLMAILSKHLTEMPVPPSERRADLAIPGPLSELVMSMLAKQPDGRPPTMDRVADRLRAIGATAPTHAPSPQVAPASQPPEPARASRPSNQIPSVVSAPPGVPRRLTTPVPQQQPPTGQPVAQQPQPQPPQPRPPQPRPPQPQPQAQAFVPQQPTAPETMRVRRASRSGLIWAIVAAVLIAGAGTGAFFALQAGGEGQEASADSPTTSEPAAERETGSDVPSLADWDIKDEDPPAEPTEPAQAPEPTAPGDAVHSDSADFFGDRSVADEIWRHPTLPLHVHYPGSFRIDRSAAPLVTIGGNWKGTRTQIGVIALDVGVPQPPAAIRAMVINVVSGFGGVVTSEGREVIAGASRYSGEYQVRGQVKGQFVVYDEGPVLAIVGVAVPPGRFDRSARFRETFFDRAVGIDR